MNEISYTNWPAMSDKALAEHIGAFIRYHRLEQNITQDSLAHAAGISRSTLSQLEKGGTVTLATLIQVLRVLDQLHVLEVFKVDRNPGPLSLVKMYKDIKQRARQKQEEKIDLRKNGKSSYSCRGTFLGENMVGAVAWNESTGLATFEYAPKFKTFGWDIAPLQMPISSSKKDFFFSSTA